MMALKDSSRIERVKSRQHVKNRVQALTKLGELDSGSRRNDGKRTFATFNETVKQEGRMGSEPDYSMKCFYNEQHKGTWQDPKFRLTGHLPSDT
jgi:hypothetical protein